MRLFSNCKIAIIIAHNVEYIYHFKLLLCWSLSSSDFYLPLCHLYSGWNFLEAVHGWGMAKGPYSEIYILQCITHILHISHISYNDKTGHSYNLPKESPKDI